MQQGAMRLHSPCVLIEWHIIHGYLDTFIALLMYFETCQTDYIKRAMNVSKYSSSLVMQMELGRYPITHRAWSSAIKYWQRLRKSSANVLLNSAYKTVCTEDHPWIQGVHYLLESNGFGDHYHQNVDLHDEFYKIFINRLNVQFEKLPLVRSGNPIGSQCYIN